MFKTSIIANHSDRERKPTRYRSLTELFLDIGEFPCLLSLCIYKHGAAAIHTWFIDKYSDFGGRRRFQKVLFKTRPQNLGWIKSE